MVLLLPPPKQPGKGNAFVEFLTNSPEQIAESIDRTGLRGKLDQVAQTAIARARGSRRKLSAPTINRTVEVDPEKDAF